MDLLQLEFLFFQQGQLELNVVFRYSFIVPYQAQVCLWPTISSWNNFKSLLPFCSWIILLATSCAVITQYTQVCPFLCCFQTTSSQFKWEIVSDHKVPDPALHSINFQPVPITPILEVIYLLRKIFLPFLHQQWVPTVYPHQISSTFTGFLCQSH